MALTAKKKLFTEYYIATGNATQSAIKAGYAERSARVTGSRLVRDNDVLQYIDHLKAKEAGTLPTYTDPKQALIDLMNNEDKKIALAACTALLPYFHARLGEQGKKAAKREQAEQATTGGRFATLDKQKIH